MEASDSFKVVVEIEMRPDGGLRVWSADVPGLVLSSKDPERALQDIKPALETILSARLGCDVVAKPLRSIAELMDERQKILDQAFAAPAKAAARRSRDVRPEPIYKRARTLEFAAQACV